MSQKMGSDLDHNQLHLFKGKLKLFFKYIPIFINIEDPSR